jgi:hypothetical protein
MSALKTTADEPALRETRTVVSDSWASSPLLFPAPGENAGEAFRHPLRYAP